MPTTLSKTRKQIAKKRNGHVDALHEFSRDSKRLHKASVRDDKLQKLAATRGKKEQPMRKTAHFAADNELKADLPQSPVLLTSKRLFRRRALSRSTSPLSRSSFTSASTLPVARNSSLTFSSFVHQYDEEYAEVKKTRRPGRPASAKEDLLKLKISTLEDEYKGNGFCEFCYDCIGYGETNKPQTFLTSQMTPTS